MSFETVLDSYKHMGLNVKGIDAKQKFYDALKTLVDPEKKRKAIGKTFIEVFDETAHEIKDVKWLAQGTIYPDIIESRFSVKGPSVTIQVPRARDITMWAAFPSYMKLQGGLSRAEYVIQR